jgi:hypothetical protein
MDTKPPACGSELVLALPKLVADGLGDLPDSDRANLDLSSTIVGSKSGPSRNRAPLSWPKHSKRDVRRKAKSLVFAAVWGSAVSGWSAAHASECGACDQTITVSRGDLECLNGRIEELVEAARATNPLLINLSECPQDPRKHASSVPPRGELPCIPVVPGGSAESDCTIPPTSPLPASANFAILSLRQLECLQQNLSMLAAGADEPARFDFDVCDGP